MRRLIAVIMAMVAVPAVAQTQSQQDRIDEVSRFTVTSSACAKVGMTINPELPTRIEHDFAIEAAGWTLSPEEFDRIRQASISRQLSIFKADLESFSQSAKMPAELRRVREVFLKQAKICVAASEDPLFKGLVFKPSGYNIEDAATVAADSLLEAGGLASWQTASVQVRGDLMTLAGVCRDRIGATRSDALISEYSRSDDPKVRKYLLASFDEGLADPSIISTAAGCNRAIAGLRAKARAIER